MRWQFAHMRMRSALDRLQTPFVLAEHLTRSHHNIRINTPAPQLNPSTPFHRWADEQLIQTALDGRPLIRGWHLAGGHQCVGVPQLPSRTLPVRRGVELRLDRPTKHRPQVHHQPVGVEPQRRLLIRLAGDCRLGCAV